MGFASRVFTRITRLPPNHLIACSSWGCQATDLAAVIEDLRCEQTKLDTMLRACEKAVETVERLDIVPDRLRCNIQKLLETQEAGERMKAELSFSLKFKKSLSSGVPLSFDTTTALLQDVLRLREDLGADARVCKAHMPVAPRVKKA